MSDKPPFKAAHNCICAYPDMPVLQFYAGYFDTVYILFHPFYQDDEQGKITKVVSWQELVFLAGFKNIKQLDIALRNYIGGLAKKWENKLDVDTLLHTCEVHNLQLPTAGEFQEALIPAMLKSLQQQGHPYMFIADEFGFERKAIYIQDLMEGKDDVKLTYGGQGNWYTNKNEILYTTHWDSYFTLLCADRKTVESILAIHPFEGFYCNERTEIYWSLRD